MPWKKGQSGNPAGSKKTKPITDALWLALNRAAAGGDKKVLNQVADTLIKKALKTGDVSAIKEIWDRIEGKVPQQIATPEDQPIKQEITFRWGTTDEAAGNSE
jgi:Family of unknown function (DUF5681)